LVDVSNYPNIRIPPAKQTGKTIISNAYIHAITPENLGSGIVSLNETYTGNIEKSAE